MTCPWLKIAFVKWCYKQKVVHGYCVSPDAQRMKACALSVGVCGMAERMLKWIRGELSPVVIGMDAFSKTQVLGNLDIAVCNAILRMPKSQMETGAFTECLKEELVPVLRLLRQKLTDDKQGLQLPELPKPLSLTDLDEPTPEEHKAKANAQSVHLLPKVIKYTEEGLPLEEQEAIVVEDKVSAVYSIPWRDWASAAIVAAHIKQATAKSGCFHAMLSLWQKTYDPNCAVELVRDGANVRLLATEDLAAGRLLTTCAVTAPERLADTALNPLAVDVKYSVTGVSGETSSTSFKVYPDFGFPKPASAASATSAVAAQWTTRHSLFLFWAIKREHEDERVNCEIGSVVVNNVLATAFPATEHVVDRKPVTETVAIEVPVITNNKEIKKGQELCVKWHPPPLKKVQKRVLTWVDHSKASPLKTQKT